MPSLFVSDAHIRDMNNLSARFMNLFFERIVPGAERLYILGDLFDFWVGYRGVIYTRYLPLLERLRAVAEGGVKIIYVEGNHDFRMGHFFTDHLKAEVWENCHTDNLYGRKIYMTHGDRVFKRDFRYQILRNILRSKAFHTLEYIIPPAEAERMGLYLSTLSRRNVIFDGERLNERFITFARGMIRRGCDGVVLAHSHTPFLKYFHPAEVDGKEGRFYANTGDFLTHFTYLLIDDEGRVFLKRLQDNLPPQVLRKG